MTQTINETISDRETTVLSLGSNTTWALAVYVWFTSVYVTFGASSLESSEKMQKKVNENPRALFAKQLLFVGTPTWIDKTPRKPENVKNLLRANGTLRFKKMFTLFALFTSIFADFSA